MAKTSFLCCIFQSVTRRTVDVAIAVLQENITEEKNVTGEDVNSGEEACIENDDESPSKKLVDTSSTDSIKGGRLKNKKANQVILQ